MPSPQQFEVGSALLHHACGAGPVGSLSAGRRLLSLVVSVDALEREPEWFLGTYKGLLVCPLCGMKLPQGKEILKIVIKLLQEEEAKKGT